MVNSKRMQSTEDFEMQVETIVLLIRAGNR